MRASLNYLLNQFPSLRRVLRSARSRLFPSKGISSHYVNLQSEVASTEATRLRNSWQDNGLPTKQRKLVDRQLKEYRSGARIDVFDVFIDSLRHLPDLAPSASLLEIGCSSGFYSEVIEISKLPIQYSGCDYSEAFIRLAKVKYPSIDFSIEDATALRYLDSSFDIVVSGCCLLHIPEYAKAIEETARVTSQYAIFHRTPIVWGQPEQWYRKQAYGIETVEIHFNETEFLALLTKNKMELVATYTLHEEKLNASGAQGSAIRTYVCRKLDK